MAKKPNALYGYRCVDCNESITCKNDHHFTVTKRRTIIYICKRCWANKLK